MKQRLSENMKWWLALILTVLVTELVAAIIAYADDEAYIHGHVLPFLAQLRAATDSGVTILPPAAVALAWLVRVVWRRLRAHGLLT